MRLLFTQFFLGSVIFPYNSLYTQAVAYTTYFELGEPVFLSVWDNFLLTLPNMCLRLASEKFVLASESNLSLATGLAS